MGSTTWETESHNFVGPDGSTYTLDDIQIGGAPSPNLALENGSLIYYIVTGPVKKLYMIIGLTGPQETYMWAKTRNRKCALSA